MTNKSTFLVVVLVAVLATFCNASAVVYPRDDTAIAADQNVEFVASSRITDHQILEAFEGAGHRPLRTWDDNNGTTYQSHYVFDEDEWNAMHDKLWQAAGYTGTGLDARVAFYCEGFKGDPWTYTSTLGVVVGSICGGFHWGVSYAGKVQIVKRTKIRPDGPHIDNRYGNAIIVSAKFIWKLSAFAGAIYCNNAMNYGISNACSAQISGDKGEAKGTQGFLEKYGGGDFATVGISLANA